MTIIPGLLLALVLAFAGQYLSKFIGIDLLGLPKSPISAIMMAIILGIIIRNTISLPASLQPGIRFGLVRVLRLGIVLLGIIPRSALDLMAVSIAQLSSAISGIPGS